MMNATLIKDAKMAATIPVKSGGLDAEITFFKNELGFHLTMIKPANAPCYAEMEGHGMRVILDEHASGTPPSLTVHLALEKAHSQADTIRSNLLHSPSGAMIMIELITNKIEFPAIPPQIFISRLGNGLGNDKDRYRAFHAGRAGMLYRELVTPPLSEVISASHIAVLIGGKVPDHVHFHRIKFQVICCLSGWAELAYENQGEPFRFCEGDVVLQPPGIRHIVMECSDRFEVVELSAPAEHDTIVDDRLSLRPEFCNPNASPFNSISDQTALWQLEEGNAQAFCLSRAKEANWIEAHAGLLCRETGVDKASGNYGDVRFYKAEQAMDWQLPKGTQFGLVMLLDGTAKLADETLEIGDSVTLTPDAVLSLDAELQQPCTFLVIML